MTTCTVTAPNGRKVITELDADFTTVYLWCSEHFKFDTGKWIADYMSQNLRLHHIHHCEEKR